MVKYRNFVIVVLSILLTMAALELWGFSYLYNSAQQQFDYNQLVKTEEPVDVFEETKIDGQSVLMARYFPTLYYSDHSDLEGKYVSKLKSKSSFRIFSYGGSTTAGSPFGHWGSFSFQLKRALEQVKKDKVKVELVNFGVSTFGSSRVLKMVEKTIDFEPDLVLIYTGHNELCDHSEFVKSYQSLSKLGLLSNSYAIRAGVQFLSRTQTQKSWPFKKAICEQPTSNLATTQMLDKIYETNIRSMLEITRQAGVQAILVSQPSNYFIQPGDGLGSELANKYFQEGLEKLKMGQVEQARRSLRAAIDYDSLPQRFRSSQNDILKQLADSVEGAYFVDAMNLFDKRHSDGLSDGRTIVDIMHPNLTGNQHLGEIIFDEGFVKNGIRPDLFEYSKFDRTAYWTFISHPERYFRLCERYLGLKDKEACLSQLKSTYHEAKDTDEKRRSRRYWEFELIDLLLNKDKDIAKIPSELNRPFLKDLHRKILER